MSLRISVSIFVVAVLLNYAWEMTQAVLYEPMGSVAEATWRCFVASLGDGVMILAIFAAGWLTYRSPTWFVGSSLGHVAFTVLASVLLGAAVELWGLSTGRWDYNDRMAILPGIAVGLVPLLQMAVLSPLTLWIAARRLSRRAPVDA